MESASVAFCYEALRHCYHILGKERFRAETEYVMRCFDNKPVEEKVSNIIHIDDTISKTEVIEEKIIEVKKESAKPILKKVKETKPVEVPKNIVVEEKPIKWKRTQLPDEERCKRVLPYNGGQCTFRRQEGCEFCPRHVGK